MSIGVLVYLEEVKQDLEDFQLDWCQNPRKDVNTTENLNSWYRPICFGFWCLLVFWFSVVSCWINTVNVQASVSDPVLFQVEGTTIGFGRMVAGLPAPDLPSTPLPHNVGPGQVGDRAPGFSCCQKWSEILISPQTTSWYGIVAYTESVCLEVLQWAKKVEWRWLGRPDGHKWKIRPVEISCPKLILQGLCLGGRVVVLKEVLDYDKSCWTKDQGYWILVYYIQVNTDKHTRGWVNHCSLPFGLFLFHL